MPVELDTDSVEPRDRADFFAATAAQESRAAHQKLLAAADGEMHACIEAWQFGDATVRRSRNSGFQALRTRKLVRVAPAPQLTLPLLRLGPPARFEQETLGIQREVAPGQFYVLDANLPWTFDCPGGEGICLAVPLDSLGLSAETIHRAAVCPQASPLYPLVANHIAAMIDTADTIQADPAAHLWGDSCVEMMHAFLVSAATGGSDAAALPADLLLTHIRDYVRRHLGDPGLSPARIARDHHISLRYLYALCARAEFSLEQWIIGQRLHRVREDLAAPEHRHRTIALIAQQWGFRDPSHFTRRFRAAYGMTPTQWRRTATEHTP